MIQDLAVFERYQPLIDDWPAFQAALLRPLPTCIWTNGLRVRPAQLADLLTQEGIPFEPLAWDHRAFKLPPEFKPGHHWAFLAGLYHVQEEVSMLPVKFLDLQAGERILDLCAAPGNKAAQMAVALANRGTVVANDINYGRMRAVQQTIQRLGLVNVTLTTYDGANYPKAAGRFDKILVDVPCSCEGTSRKEPQVLHRIDPDVSGKKVGLQAALLRKAVQLCKPGGRIVYATCTYAPEENELIVDAILRENEPDLLRLVPARLEGLITSEGLTRWHGQQLQPGLRHAIRIWPHQNDSGGFFIAVIEKSRAGGDGANRSNGTEEIPKDVLFGLPPAPASYLEILAERFGFGPDTFAPYTLFQPNKKRLYVAAPNHQPPAQPQPDSVGMSFMKIQTRFPKLSTAAAMLFGQQATRNYLDLTLEQVRAYINRQNFDLSTDQSQHCTGIGFVLVRYQGFVLGVALFRPHGTRSGGTVESLFPKGWSPK